MSEQRKRKAAKAPVSAHPAFPAIVAVWFAALLGVGSVVLPIALFENASEASGLASLWVAAQPPLGPTARIAIAFVGAILGVIVGLAVARRVIAAQSAVRGRATGPDREPRQSAVGTRPIFAHEELGEGGLDAEEEPRGPLLGRRGLVAITDDGAVPGPLDPASLPSQECPAAPDTLTALEDEPLDLGEFGPGEHSAYVLDEEPIPPAEHPEGGPVHAANPGDPPLPSASVAGVAPRVGVAPEEEALVDAALADPGIDPGPRASFERPLNELGVVDLVERFARALQLHREMARTAASPARAAAVALEAFPPAGPAQDGAERHMAIPVALRSVDFDLAADGEAEDEDEGEAFPALDLALPVSEPSSKPAPHRGRASSEPGVERADFSEYGDEVDDGHDEDYPSLLAMKSPTSLPRKPIRIAHEPLDTTIPAEPAAEPVVALPGSQSAGTVSSTDSGDTERALREALEKLQKLSGAA